MFREHVSDFFFGAVNEMFISIIKDDKAESEICVRNYFLNIRLVNCDFRIFVFL